MKTQFFGKGRMREICTYGFDEGDVASEKPRRGSLLYKAAKMTLTGILLAGMSFPSSAMAMTGEELSAAIAAAGVGGTVEIPGDVEIAESLLVDKKLTLRGVGEERPTIRRTVGVTMFTLASTGDLTLENLILDGNKSAGVTGRALDLSAGTMTLGADAAVRNFKGVSATSGLINLTSSSHFVMEDGSEISGFENSHWGLGVVINKGALFDMKGGIITGCAGTSARTTYVDQYDGTVYLNEGTFNFSGGTITGNTSVQCVAGICFYSGTMTLSGNATCTNNVGGYANDIMHRSNGGSLYIAPGFEGWATYLSLYEHKDKAVVNGVYKSGGMTEYVAGFGRISCQTNSNLIFCGYYNDESVHWATTAFTVNGVPTGFWDEVQDFLKTGEDCLVEVFKDVLCTSSVPLPATTGRLTLRGAGEGERVYRRETPGGQTAARSIISVEQLQATVRLENLVLDGAGIEGAPLVSMTSGRLELGPGSVLRNASATGTYPAAVNLIGANTECTMEEGAVIKDCESKSSSGYGAIVRIGNSSVAGSFKMSGGLITNCSSSATSPASSGYGGMVYVYKGVFEMTGGIIAGNVAEKSSAGVLNYNGTVRLGGTAIIENNVGAADDLYLYKKDSCTFFGDFRGRVGVSSPNQNAGETFRVRAEDGATGAWCFKAIGTDKGLIGKTDEDAADGTIVWAAPDGTVGGISVASAEDAMRCLPKTMGTDEASRALLPISVSGVAKAASGTINVTFDPKDFLSTGLEQLPLIHSEDGPMTGKIAFTLSSGSDRWRVARRGADYVLTPRGGLCISIR